MRRAASHTVLLGVVLALVAAAVGAAATGAMAPLVFVEDAGPVVRWSALLIQVLRDGAAAVTLASLLAAASWAPGRRTPSGAAPDTVERALRIASTAALTWVVAGLLGVVLVFADAAGIPPTDPGFARLLVGSVWLLDPTRIGLLSAAGAAVIACALTRVRSRVGALWLAALAALAVAIIGLAGHSGTALDHETSTNALGVHILAVGVWAGGLLVLVLLRTSIGSSLTVLADRFSTAALWCFVAVAASGAVASTTRLSGWEDLGSAYGMLLLVKILALLLLGVAGWAHRRRTLADLAVGHAGAFLRLVLGEIVVMAVALGAGAALARSAPPAPEEMADASRALKLTGFPEPAAPAVDVLWTTWRVDWLLLGVAVTAIGLYAAGLVTMHRARRAWPVSRSVCWFAGWGIFVWLTCGAPAVYGRVALSWFLAQHLALLLVTALLVALAAPISLLTNAIPRRPDDSLGARAVADTWSASAARETLTRPVVAAVVVIVGLLAFLLTGLLELALRTHPGHLGVMVGCVLIGSLLGTALASPRTDGTRGDAQLPAAVAVAVGVVMIGVLLSRGTTLLAPGFFGELAISWIPEPLADQQRAGVVTAVLGVAWGVTASAVLFLRRRRPLPEAGVGAATSAGAAGRGSLPKPRGSLLVPSRRRDRRDGSGL